MANKNAPFGLRPVRYLNGSPWTGAARPYYVPSDYATALYIGDPVVIVGDSNDNEYMGFPPGSLSEVNLGAAGDATAFTGAVVSVHPVTRESSVYKPASTEALVYVADDPNLVFQIRDDGAGTPSADWVGLNANLVSGSGSTGSGLSGWALNGSSPAADASNQLFILGLAAIMENEIGDYAVWDVRLNQQTYAPASGLGIA